MGPLRAFRPSPATVIAVVALLVALAGTGYAATSLPANSVGSTQLKTGAVTSSKLAANSVTSAKVANGSLLASDFKTGQLKAGPPGPPGPPGAPGVAGAAGATGPAGGGATLAEKLVSSGSSQTTTTTAFINLTGATTTIDVPTGQTATIIARFSAESSCYGTTGGWCTLRILVDGNEMQPVVGTDFAFDSTNGNKDVLASWESHAVIRYATGVAAGTHTVTVQWGDGGSATPTFWLDDWALDVSAVKP